MRCFNCQKKGHFARNCPKSRKGHKGKFHGAAAVEEEGTVDIMVAVGGINLYV